MKRHYHDVNAVIQAINTRPTTRISFQSQFPLEICIFCGAYRHLAEFPLLSTASHADRVLIAQEPAKQWSFLSDNDMLISNFQHVCHPETIGVPQKTHQIRLARLALAAAGLAERARRA